MWLMKTYNKIMYGVFIFCFLITNFAMAQLPDIIPYRKGSKWGFANSKKKIVIEPVYDSVTSFTEKRAGFLKDGKWGALILLERLL